MSTTRVAPIPTDQSKTDQVDAAGTGAERAPRLRVWTVPRIAALALFAAIPLALILIPHGVRDSLLGIAGQIGSAFIFARSR